jgi:hypothetical protein
MNRIALTFLAVAVAGLLACKGDQKKEPGADPGADPTAAPADKAAPAQPAAPATTPPAEEPAGEATATAATGEPASTGIPECDSYIKRLLDCQAYPAQGKETLRANIDVWKKASEAGGDSAKAAADACKKSMQQSDQGLKAINC